MDIRCGVLQQTALHRAAEKHSLEAVELLLRLSPKNSTIALFTKDINGHTPFLLAVKQGRIGLNIAARLLEFCSSHVNAVHTHTAECGFRDCKLNELVNVADINGRTALHFAARSGQADMCRLILSNDGVRVDPGDKWGKTPLMLSPKPEATLLLLGHGANPNAVAGKIGWTALKYALSFDHRFETETVRHLLEHGASPFVGDGVLEEVQDVDKINLVHEYMNDDELWKSHVPSLEYMCVWKIKRMRSQLDEEYCCDSVFPDAMCWEYFRDWKGSEKWTKPWRE